jgi:hypothetical protein
MRNKNWHLVWTRKDSKDEYTVNYFAFKTRKEALDKREEVTKHPENYSTRIHNKLWYDSTIYSSQNTIEDLENRKKQEDRLKTLLNL